MDNFFAERPALAHALAAGLMTLSLWTVLRLAGVPLAPVLAGAVASAVFFGREAGQRDHDLEHDGVARSRAYALTLVPILWTRSNWAQWLAAAVASAFVAVALGAASPARAAPLRSLRPGGTYVGVVVRAVDGDTLRVRVEAWANTPLDEVNVRVYGIDAPESRKPPGKCKAEVALGLRAKALASAMVRPGDLVSLVYRGLDKYARVDATVTLPDGRDWASVMLTGGLARPYGGGKKPDWCGKQENPR